MNWEHTPENNKKLFNTKINSDENSKFQVDWLKNYGILNIMKVSVFNLDEFE